MKKKIIIVTGGAGFVGSNLIEYSREKSKFFLTKDSLHFSPFMYNTIAGDYCESVTPDPIPNSEVKPFCADGTLS